MKVGTPPPLKCFNDIYSLMHELIFSCARRRIGSVKMAAST